MKLRDFGADAARDWWNQLLEWSRKRITFDENMDCVSVTSYIATTETEVGHSLGRIPKYVLEVASFPNGTKGIEFTKEPTNQKLFLKRGTAGNCTLLLF